MSLEVPTAALLPIGDEVLRGDTVDTNSAFLAGELTRRGVQVRRIITVPDDLEQIVVELRSALAAHDFVITTGGIGPTPDDMTREAVALALELPLEPNAGALSEYETKLGRELNSGQREMCRLPRGCRLIHNPSVGPPGCVVGRVYVLPGVPSIMKAMWAGICDEFSGPTEHSRSFMAGLPESRFSTLMRELGERFPAVKIGSYPRQKDAGWEVEIRLRSRDLASLEQVEAEFQSGLESLRT